MVDSRLEALSTDTAKAVRIEAEEFILYNGNILRPITKYALIVYECLKCFHRYRVRADVAIEKRFKCVSPVCWE